MSTLQQIFSSALKGCCAPAGPYGTAGYPHFAVATDGLTAQQAAACPSERLNSVWAVVNHLAWLQAHTCDALLGKVIEPEKGVKSVGDTRYWPALPVEINDAAWQAARQAVLESNQRLVETIAALPDSQLTEPIPAYFNLPPTILLPHIVTHFSFHVGEIITVRHVQRLWVEHLFT